MPLDQTTGVTPRDVEIKSETGVLQGRLYLPAEPAKAALVLNSATGVPQGYYKHFATWLATERGIACLTYDYSGFGRSCVGHERDAKVTMADWALKDQPAARQAMREIVPDVPLWVIGHSVGAMLMPLQEETQQIDRMIGVASGLVHHTDHPWPYQALARLFWFGHTPFLVRVLGYLPGRMVGFGADLPAGVYWQWRRWCTTPKAYVPEIGAALPRPTWDSSRIRTTLFAFSDDKTIPPVCTERLAEVYGAGTETKVLRPADFGLKAVDHLGAFSKHNKALWPVLIDTAD